MTAGVTTVVATRDRWHDLARTLPHHEPPVIVVDNASRDGTPARVRDAFPDVGVVALPRNLAAVGRNVGVRAARTPYVAFADDDSWWEPGALERAAALLDRHPRLGVVAARVLVGGRTDPTCEAMAASPLDHAPGQPAPAVLGFLACGAVVRREAFLAVGGFHELVAYPGEEQLLALDLAASGWALSYAEDVVAHHEPSTSRPPAYTRRVLDERSALLTALLRRPWRTVADTALGALRHGSVGALGLAAALPRAPRALAQRRRLPASVEAARSLLDEPSATVGVPAL
ncbi:glycosyltransferase family 2 protein [Nocardioides cheoyonin]|uniref:glycosyltransferase family 2 protein n=1 Tax=Nocardioides cheoyonin TaxID=3156615 RepID=UPI0032B50E89